MLNQAFLFQIRESLSIQVQASVWIEEQKAASMLWWIHVTDEIPSDGYFPSTKNRNEWYTAPNPDTQIIIRANNYN